MSGITPKTNNRLIGHEEAEATLMQDYKDGKMAHGWIISGPRGIGKATFAYRFARTLLSGELPGELSEENPIFKRIAAGSHTDMLVVEQAFDEKKDEKVREISVDQAREIAQFLSLTPGEGKWRVVIIDSADALNANGANAILKILEEPPPQTVLMLIAHNPSRLLPTIRSRCRTLKLRPLQKQQFISVMRHVSPALDSADIKMLAQLSAFAPGIALELHALGALEMYNHILELTSQLPRLDAARIHAFADQMATGKVHTNWQVFTQLVLFMFSRAALYGQGAALEPLSDEESATLHTMALIYPPAVWASRWQQVAEQFLLAERLHLDYKQLIITFFHSIPAQDGLQIGSNAA